MIKCNYVSQAGERCVEDATTDNGLCIFHMENKSLKEFTDRFWEYVSNCEENEEQDIILCDGFIFPDGFLINRAPLKCLEFKDSIFLGDLHIDNIDFKFGPFLEGCKFRHDLSIFNIRTGGQFYLKKIRVKGSFTMEWSDICGIAQIKDCTFLDRIIFNRIIIGGSNLFEFKNNNCHKEVEFIECQNEGMFILGDNKLHTAKFIFLNGLYLSRSQLCKVSSIEIEKLKAVKTNLQKIEFEGCRWPYLKGRKIFSDEVRKKLSQMDNEELEICIRNYRMLKHNFDACSETELASDMYIGEMETRREINCRTSKYSITRFFRKHLFSTVTLYRYLSLYGERFGRPLLFYGLLLFVFASVYLLNGFSYEVKNPVSGLGLDIVEVNYEIHPIGFSNLFDASAVEDFGHALRISLQASTLQRTSSYQLLGLNPEFYTLHLAISTALLTLSLLAMRRKFRRTRSGEETES